MSATTGSSGSANLTSVSQNTYNPAELSEERAFQTPDCQTVVSSEERQRMRRRLFRALDEPEMPLIAVDCGAMSPDAMRDVLDRFATSPQLRHSYNLVLALPVDQEWLAGETAEWVEDFKSVVFERGFEEKVARIWLHEQHCEWDALTQYVDQYGGLIIDNDTAVEAWPGKPPGVSYRRSMK